MTEKPKSQNQAAPLLPPPPPPLATLAPMSSLPSCLSDCRHSPVSSMELAVNNGGVLTEILVRLPAKSLTRFKCVSKKWLSLISSDYFCHIHTLRRPKLQQSLILQTHSCEFYYWKPTTYGEQSMIPYSLSVPVSNCIVVHACNGLMLLYLKQCDEPLKDGYYVYNPTTRRSGMISLTHNDEFPHVAVMTLAFNPSNSPYYKIVCFKSTKDSFDSLKYPHQIEVYDSESQTWKLGLQSTDFVPWPSSYGTHWNNAIYWSDYDEGDDYLCNYCYFDIDKNEMETLSSPQVPLVAGADTFNCCSRLVELNGHLYHIEYCVVMDGEIEMSRSVVVWELDHHSQWLLKHHDTLTSTEWMTKFITFEELIGGSGSDGDVIYNILTCGISTQIRVYSFLDKSYHEFRSQPFYRPDREWFDVRGHQFGETLALV